MANHSRQPVLEPIVESAQKMAAADKLSNENAATRADQIEAAAANQDDRDDDDDDEDESASEGDDEDDDEEHMEATRRAGGGGADTNQECGDFVSMEMESIGGDIAQHERSDDVSQASSPH